MDGVRQMCRHLPGFAEKEIQHIDAVGTNVKQRATARQKPDQTATRVPPRHPYAIHDR